MVMIDFGTLRDRISHVLATSLVGGDAGGRFPGIDEDIWCVVREVFVPQ